MDLFVPVKFCVKFLLFTKAVHHGSRHGLDEQGVGSSSLSAQFSILRGHGQSALLDVIRQSPNLQEK